MKMMTPRAEAVRLTKLWQEHGPNTYPLDIDFLVEKGLNDSGYAGTLSTRRASFDSTEGCLVKIGDPDIWEILLNQNTDNTRRLRFTHAHELGHFMCHRTQKNRFEDNFDTLNDFNCEIEQEANTFAAWLLLPANILREEFGLSPWCVKSLKEIGNRFECSLQSSALRFVSLAGRPLAFVVSRDGMILWACKHESAPYMSAYNFGDGLPEGSHAFAAHSKRCGDEEPVNSGLAWTAVATSVESQYFDTSGLGYQYTCIEFRA